MLNITPSGVMFDTHIFDEILKNPELLQKLPRNIKYYVTHIQYDEIEKIVNLDLKSKLLYIFNKIVEDILPTEGFVIGISRLNYSKLGSEEDKAKINQLTNNNPNHMEDALILLTAKYNNILVISNDRGTPFKRAQKSNYSIITLEEFIDIYT